MGRADLGAGGETMDMVSRVAIASALALSLAACGSEDPIARVSGASMQAQAETVTPANAGTAPKENRAPTLSSVDFRPTEPTPGEPLEAVVRGSDPDGDRLRYRFAWTVGGRRLAEKGPTVALVGARKGDLVEMTVTASDGWVDSEPLEASTQIRNSAPQVRSVRLETDGPASSGRDITARPEAQDPDGDGMSFEYVWRLNGDRLDEDGPVLSAEGLKRGDTVEVFVTASDGEDESDEVRSPALVLANAPPVIVSQPGGADADGVFHYRILAEDPDEDRSLRFSLVQAPEGMTVVSTRGEVVWKPAPEQVGVHVVEVMVEDLQGGHSSQRFHVEVGPGADAEGAAPPASS